MRFRITTKTVSGQALYRAQVKEYWWQPIWINAYAYRTVRHGTWVADEADAYEQIESVVVQREKEQARRKLKKIISHKKVVYDPQTGMFE